MELLQPGEKVFPNAPAAKRSAYLARTRSLSTTERLNLVGRVAALRAEEGPSNVPTANANCRHSIPNPNSLTAKYSLRSVVRQGIPAWAGVEQVLAIALCTIAIHCSLHPTSIAPTPTLRPLPSGDRAFQPSVPASVVFASVLALAGVFQF